MPFVPPATFQCPAPTMNMQAVDGPGLPAMTGTESGGVRKGGRKNHGAWKPLSVFLVPSKQGLLSRRHDADAIVGAIPCLVHEVWGAGDGSKRAYVCVSAVCCEPAFRRASGALDVWV